MLFFLIILFKNCFILVTHLLINYFNLTLIYADLEFLFIILIFFILKLYFLLRFFNLFSPSLNRTPNPLFSITSTKPLNLNATHFTISIKITFLNQPTSHLHYLSLNANLPTNSINVIYSFILLLTCSPILSTSRPSIPSLHFLL
jgi:hypothetical protein